MGFCASDLEFAIPYQRLHLLVFVLNWNSGRCDDVNDNNDDNDDDDTDDETVATPARFKASREAVCQPQLVFMVHHFSSLQQKDSAEIIDCNR